VGRNSMAKISSTPGKTQLINHFAINGLELDKEKDTTPWYLTDLPGFGYAKSVSQSALNGNELPGNS
jgi:GTP-binding protein